MRGWSSEDIAELSMEEKLKIPTRMLAVSVRLANALLGLGIGTVRDLTKLRLSRFKLQHNVGRTTCNELVEIMKDIGVSLAPETRDLRRVGEILRSLEKKIDMLLLEREEVRQNEV